jgi:hypothetical protein
MGDRVENAAGNALGALNIGAMVKDPGAAWANLKTAAKANPQLAGLIDIGEQYPGMKWGIMAGAGMGMLFGEGAGGKIAGAFKGALVLGLIFDAISWFTGKKSVIGSMIKSAQDMPDQTAPQQTPPHAPAIDMRAAAPAPTQKPAITTETNLGQQFNAAQNATTPLDASQATNDPAANQSPVAGAFAASALPQNLPPAPVLAQVGDPSKNAKNDHLFNVPSVA